jgi:hypothetical protein
VLGRLGAGLDRTATARLFLYPWAAARLLAEERSVQLPRLLHREARRRKRINCLIRDVSLLPRQRRGIALPPQTGADVFLKPYRFAGQFVSDPMQFPYLIQEGLELVLVDPGTLRVPTESRSSSSASHEPRDPQPVRIYPPKLAQLGPAQSRPTPEQRRKPVVAYGALL